MKFYVYAKRHGQQPRPMAGPLPSNLAALELQESVRHIGLARRYLSRHSDIVYVGPESPAVAGRVGILNRWLGLATTLEAAAG